MSVRAAFTRPLMQWYHRQARDLPWRQTRDPYNIWISEIMLQQTTVNTVIPFYEAWMKKYPDVWHVARARERTILKSWQGLGYYQRARNIHRAAKMICREWEGRLPGDAAALAALPGFGPYTRAAVLSIAFGSSVPVVDTNVRRVVMRVLNCPGYANSKQDKLIVPFLTERISSRAPGDFNQALMELGALVCRNRTPLCLRCPIRGVCGAYAAGTQEVIPTPKKVQLKNIEAAIAVIEDGENFLIQRRAEKGLLAGLWEFPGGKIEAQETPEAAVKREVAEELGVKIREISFLMELTHFYTEFRVKLYVWRCKLEHNPSLSGTRKWVSLKSLLRYPMPSGSARIVERLCKL